MLRCIRRLCSDTKIRELTSDSTRSFDPIDAVFATSKKSRFGFHELHEQQLKDPIPRRGLRRHEPELSKEWQNPLNQ